MAGYGEKKMKKRNSPPQDKEKIKLLQEGF